MVVSPTAMAPIISARWEMDLSPGTSIAPLNAADVPEFNAVTLASG
jgi:hypothetical protein